MKNNYYIDLYKKHFIHESELKKRIENASAFFNYIMQNIDSEILYLLYDWFLDLYFYGVDKNANVILFEEDIKRFAKNGYNNIPIIMTEALGSIAIKSPIGFVVDVWNESSPYYLGPIEKSKIIKILEQIKLQCPEFIFSDINWDYFLLNCWPSIFTNAFEYYYSGPIDDALKCIISKKINDRVKDEGLVLSRIEKISSKIPISCIGFDMSTF